MNTIILNTEAGFDTEIVLCDALVNNSQTALVSQEGNLRLFRVFPKYDPSDILLEESVVEAAIEYQRVTRSELKVWSVGKLRIENNVVRIGRHVVGVVADDGVKVNDLSTIVRSFF